MADVTPASIPIDLAQRLCSAAEMRAMDTYAIETLEIPARLLMENAAHWITAKVAQLCGGNADASIVVCCGRGNNGGDGYAAARLMQNRGLNACVIALGEPAGGDALANRDVWSTFGDTWDFPAEAQTVQELLGGADIIVDALFGTGLSRTLEGDAARLIEAINGSPAPVKIAVDVPSGINADNGQAMGLAVKCTHTVTVQVGKIGLFQPPGSEYAGQTAAVPISIPPRWPDDAPGTYLVTEEFARALLPPRPLAGHKGTFGHLLAVCGSAGMAGAAALAGLGAIKSGTGLVTVGVPPALQDRLLHLAPELMTLAPGKGSVAAFEGAHLSFMLAEAESRTASVIGCGFGRRDSTGQFTRDYVQRCPLPLLIDADGLYFMDGRLLAARKPDTVITPHGGELSRLAALSVDELSADRVAHARRLAREWGVVLVFKGSGTVIAAPDGSAFINPTGDDGLATAGSGDVLSGIIGGFLAQRIPALNAAILGVYMHGLARDLAREEVSGASFSASDLVQGINRAMLRLQNS